MMRQIKNTAAYFMQVHKVMLLLLHQTQGNVVATAVPGPWYTPTYTHTPHRAHTQILPATWVEAGFLAAEKVGLGRSDSAGLPNLKTTAQSTQETDPRNATKMVPVQRALEKDCGTLTRLSTSLMGRKKRRGHIKDHPPENAASCIIRNNFYEIEKKKC